MKGLRLIRILYFIDLVIADNRQDNNHVIYTLSSHCTLNLQNNKHLCLTKAFIFFPVDTLSRIII